MKDLDRTVKEENKSESNNTMDKKQKGAPAPMKSAGAMVTDTAGGVMPDPQAVHAKGVSPEDAKIAFRNS